jgi:hypothetical protein
MALTTTEEPDLWWCRSLGPLAPNGAPWRCVLDDEHTGVHRSAGEPTWLTVEETGQAPPAPG